MSEGQRPEGARMGSVISWGITGFLVVIIVVVGLYAKTRKPDERVPASKKLASVEVLTIRPVAHSEILTLPARVSADHVATISSEFGGILARWLVAEGSAVQGAGGGRTRSTNHQRQS